MKTYATAASDELIGRVRQFFWNYPEWWVLVISGVSWLAMLLHAVRQDAHAIHYEKTFWLELQAWMIMIAAMMLPLVRDAVRSNASASFWDRRHRAIGTFVLGYLAPWLALGVVIANCRNEWASVKWGTSIAFAIAAVWQMTPIHSFAVVACHRRIPLAQFGWRADRDCFRSGSYVGLACVVSCWPLMVACAQSGHSAVAMLVGAALAIVGRNSFRPRVGVSFFGTLALAAYFAL